MEGIPERGPETGPATGPRAGGGRTPTAAGPSSAPVAVAAYAVLGLLGALMGLLGGFQHSWYLRPVPASAIGWVLALFAVCHGAGRAMGGRGGAMAPAGGWLAVTTLWLSARPEGDLVIADDVSGYVYLYGGLLAVLAGVLLVPAGAGSWLLSGYPHGSHPVRSDSP
ncbi:DUF6113 family protein [Planomonospora sp. ID82291]|uniref:DUF6113 family protein n=1 Tax=Planomonospora sp. ID82291 TaxID=2738136 RepID=UPI0018C40402|nr:DUF6113 family protein [Planomonospora sp. ID82291]MBG0815085.1 hypothetical protein [Planomonospora sp. ID82291]